MANANCSEFNNLLMFSECRAISIIWTVCIPGYVCGPASYVMLSAYTDFVCENAKNYASCLLDLTFSTDIFDVLRELVMKVLVF